MAKPNPIPNAFERKKIREDIKIILDHNFNIELNTKKQAKASKLTPVEEAQLNQGQPQTNENIIKFLDKDFEDQEARGKYDRKVFRRRSQLKVEGKKVITESDIKEE